MKVQEVQEVQEAEILDRAIEALAKITDIQIEVDNYQHTDPIYDATGRFIYKPTPYINKRLFIPPLKT